MTESTAPEALSNPLRAASTDIVIELSTQVNDERAILRCVAPSITWDGEMSVHQRAAYVLGLREHLGMKIIERLDVQIEVTPARHTWPSNPSFDDFLADCELPPRLGAVYKVRFEPLQADQHGTE
jgi:hypothetical protein